MDLWMKIVITICGCSIIGMSMWIMLHSLGSRNSTKLDFVAWYELNEEELYIKFAESGEDREMDFNAEAACDREYELYLNEPH